MGTHKKGTRTVPFRFLTSRVKTEKWKDKRLHLRGKSILLSYWVLMSVFVQIPRSIEAPLWFSSCFRGITTLRHRVKLRHTLTQSMILRPSLTWRVGLRKLQTKLQNIQHP